MTERVRYIKLDRQNPGPTNMADFGEDSIYVMHSRGASLDRHPEEVPVQVHTEVDEMIILLDHQEGFYLHGSTPKTMTKTPFESPCVLMQPAGEYHRIVTISEGEGESILTYTDKNSTIEKFDVEIARAEHATVKPANLPVENFPAEIPVSTNLSRKVEESR